MAAMRLAHYLEQSGATLFRRRGSLPTLILLPVWLAAGADFIARGARTPPLVWEVFTFAVAASGLAVRFWISATVPEGTSGRNTERQRADELNTTGLYSVVRHPLYVANFIIYVGIALQPGVWYLPVILALVVALYYERVVLVEEAYLDREFGDAFRRWAESVPTFIPKWSGYVTPRLPFSVRAALRREFYGITALIIVFFLLDFLEDRVTVPGLALDPVWAPLGIAAIVGFFVMRFLKKRTAVLRRIKTLDPNARRDGSPS
jgi:protein-S-isoprenylcysteine O-methyltransferase Ste14